MFLAEFLSIICWTTGIELLDAIHSVAAMLTEYARHKATMRYQLPLRGYRRAKLDRNSAGARRTLAARECRLSSDR